MAVMPHLWRGDDDLVHYVEVSNWLVIYCTGESLIQLEREGLLRGSEDRPTCLWCIVVME